MGCIYSESLCTWYDNRLKENVISKQFRLKLTLCRNLLVRMDSLVICFNGKTTLDGFNVKYWLIFKRKVSRFRYF